MFERGERVGALQQTLALVEVASREPIVPKGDWDGGSFDARKARRSYMTSTVRSSQACSVATDGHK